MYWGWENGVFSGRSVRAEERVLSVLGCGCGDGDLGAVAGVRVFSGWFSCIGGEEGGGGTVGQNQGAQYLNLKNL